VRINGSLKEILIMLLALGLILAGLLWFSGCAYSEDFILDTLQEQCQDPETLSPELKKAYFELKELLKDEKDISVKIKCNPKPATEGR